MSRGRLRCWRAAVKLPRMGSFSIALLEALVSAGVSTERARAVVDLLDRSIDERYSLHAEVLATKRDVAALQAETIRSLAALELRLTRDIAANGARIAETKVDLVKWMLAALTAQTALILGVMKLV
ncbi:MAG: hypothetical protein OZ924_13010 [Burkholderiaceae bacterium]|nr:hypothetical protein [Burkholderiaceae bacterium]